VEQRDNSADRHVKIRPLDHIDRQEEERERRIPIFCLSIFQRVNMFVNV
jgi:hypothetical protein